MYDTNNNIKSTLSTFKSSRLNNYSIEAVEKQIKRSETLSLNSRMNNNNEYEILLLKLQFVKIAMQIAEYSKT